MTTTTITINNPSGLHARPASDLVKTASKFTSSIFLKFGDDEINCKSIINILSAAIVSGSVCELKIDGDDEQKALDAILALVESNFGE